MRKRSKKKQTNKPMKSGGMNGMFLMEVKNVGPKKCVFFLLFIQLVGTSLAMQIRIN